MWVGFTDPDQQFSLENPENYTITFKDDGTVNIKADCNNASGSYSVDDSSIQIEVGAMTRAMCLPESLSDEFITNLGYAAIYFFEDGNLYIDLIADGGTMEFAPAGGAITDGSGPVAIVGEASSANFTISPELYPNPTVILTDMSNYIKCQPEIFIPESRQIQGTFTKPLFPMPGEFRINLPI